MKLHVALSDVPSEVRCAKPSCEETRTPYLQRHHKSHQAMWLRIWASRRRGESKFALFVERYYKFLPEDIVLICDRHHPEIHALYDIIINEDRAITNLSLAKYSWTQAERLMKKLSDACDEWLKRKTPGLDSKQFTATRGVYKALLRKEAKKRRA